MMLSEIMTGKKAERGKSVTETLRGRSRMAEQKRKDLMREIKTIGQRRGRKKRQKYKDTRER